MSMKKTIVCFPNDKKIQVFKAESFFRRFLGLMGRKEGDYGLLLSPCNSIHTCFMRYSLDVLFLDQDYRVVEARSIKPWRVTPIIKGGHSALEFPSSLDLLKSIQPGYKVLFETE